MPEPTSGPESRAMAGGSHGLLVRAYFRVKPYLPKSVRWALRRSRIPGIMRESAGVWPINRSAAGKPDGWKGWPDGKKFALVFTHDVESPAGVENVKRLAELETRHGLRSSFNFIPEGPYEDPVETREWLTANGFEVGVHDLNHDGQLYDSRKSFAGKAKLINSYLEKWNAKGFRSGFMLHQLEWLHDLNIVYDASTFDTDPFEPQPDGSDTIFPFLVKPEKEDGRPGYVELSYTLPQDSTLFILLKESTPHIWKQKLDWIARNGGLALVNIHPDYIDFSNEDPSSSTYPVGFIEEFLYHLREHHRANYWNPLARDLANWYRDRVVDENPAARHGTPPGSGTLPPK